MVVSRVNFKHKLMHVNHLMQNHIVIVYMTRIDLEGIIRFIKASHIRRRHLSDAVIEAVIIKIVESNRQNCGRSDLISVVIRYFTLQERICNRPRRKQHIFKKITKLYNFFPQFAVEVCHLSLSQTPLIKQKIFCPFLLIPKSCIFVAQRSAHKNSPFHSI